MEMFSLENRELIDEINNGRIAPTGVFDAVVYAKDKQIEIRLNNIKELENRIDEVVLFFWDYEEKKTLYLRKTELKNGCLVWQEDVSLRMQMKFMDIDSARFAIAIKSRDKFTCGYIRNKEARREELSNGDRLICKLYSKDKEAFIAYWTEGGILSIKKRSEEAFDNEFYRVILSGAKWENSTFVGYLEIPLWNSEPQITMHSMTTKESCKWADIKITKEGFTSLKNIYRMVIDLSEGSEECEDGYYFTCNLDEHEFIVYADEQAVEEEKIHTITNNEATYDVLAVRELDGLFVLQVADQIFPVMLSVVTAVYNTAPFLAEMINSVLMQKTEKIDEYIIGNQSKDYKKRKYQQLFELILVDDGSTDGSADILDDYARLSDRIRVIHKENGGVSSARNAGIKVARGKYINFADSDDKFSENFMVETLQFFENNYEEFDILTTPIRFFDALNEEHWCNGKFRNGTRVLDLEKDFDNVLMYVNASIFKNEKVKDVRYFNEKLKTAEDINFIYSFFIEDAPRLGLIDSCEYLYRRRSSGEESLIQSSKKDKNRYLEYFSVGMKYLLSAKKKNDVKLPRYIQYLIACEMQWRFLEDGDASIAKEVLSEKEFKQYKDNLKYMMSLIDVDIIWAQEKIWREQKMFMTRLKCEDEIKKLYTKDNVQYWYNDRVLVDASSNYMQIDCVGVENGVFSIEGTEFTFEGGSIACIVINNQCYEMKSDDRYDFNKYAIGEVAFYGKHFNFTFAIDNNVDEYEIEFYEKIDNLMVKKSDIRYGRRMALNQRYSDSYIISDNWVIRKEGSLRLRPLRLNVDSLSDIYNLHSYLRYERDYQNQILKSTYENEAINNAIELRRNALSIIANRSKYFEKRIWLISDRLNLADDNGEALFIYLNEMKLNDIDIYFVISKESDDYSRLQQYGNVVAYGSNEHKLLFLLAEYNISSHFDEFVLNPFNDGCESIVFRDLACNPKFIFLQHGITKDDMSEHLNRLNMNAYGIVASSEAEYEAFTNCKYMYSDKEIWLTGMPRFDRLYHDEKKYITIMPTWRRYLCTTSKADSKKIILREGFEDTDYYKFYNSLLNNNKLIEAARKYGYKIAFKPHPVVMNSINDFDIDNSVEILGANVPYSKVYAESELCITDYSSAVMDFAYLRKPIIYAQFDKEKFFSGEHVYKKGYFDYEKNGFGEVVYDVEHLVSTIIEYMECGCKLKDKYDERITSFFKYNDKDNCKRVYQHLRR